MNTMLYAPLKLDFAVWYKNYFKSATDYKEVERIHSGA